MNCGTHGEGVMGSGFRVQGSTNGEGMMGSGFRVQGSTNGVEGRGKCTYVACASTLHVLPNVQKYLTCLN